MNKTLREEQVSSEFNYQSQQWAHKSKNGVTVDKLIFEIGMQKGFELGKQRQDLGEPFAYVIDDGFRQQITVVVQDDTRETAKRFGWDIIPLYAIPNPTTTEDPKQACELECGALGTYCRCNAEATKERARDGN